MSVSFHGYATTLYIPPLIMWPSVCLRLPRLLPHHVHFHLSESYLPRPMVPTLAPQYRHARLSAANFGLTVCACLTAGADPGATVGPAAPSAVNSPMSPPAFVHGAASNMYTATPANRGLFPHPHTPHPLFIPANHDDPSLLHMRALHVVTFFMSLLVSIRFPSPPLRSLSVA